MRAQVIGFGVVGTAQAFLLRHLGHKVSAYDPYTLPGSQIERDVDVTFICTHEKDVETALKTLICEKVAGLYVIKSTVPVGTTCTLMRKFNVHICHNPEFLRERHALNDVLNPDRIIIGKCCDAHASLLSELYAPLARPIYITDPTTSELAKLVSNAYLATLITFWNEIYELATNLSVNIKELAELVCSDHRMSRYGTAKFGEPFGGKCLPKDLNHLIEAFHKNKLNPILFNAVKEYNERLAGKCSTS